MKVWDIADKAKWVVNIVDAASGFQIGARVSDENSAAVKEAFDHSWAVWVG